MPLKLNGDKAIRRPDKMQYIDDAFVSRHSAAGRECNRKPHRNKHQRQKNDNQNDEGLRHRGEALHPQSMIVQKRGRNPRPQVVLKIRGIEICRI